MEKKYCEYCGNKVFSDSVICSKCGRQLEELKKEENTCNSNIIINNNNNQTGNFQNKKIDKWSAFLLCLFLGFVGAHKFYEGKIGLGIVYIITLGFCGIGVFIDLIVILCKPNPYYV